MYINKPGETRIFLVNKTYAMFADALAPYIAILLAAMVLTIPDKQLLIFHEEWCQVPASSQC